MFSKHSNESPADALWRQLRREALLACCESAYGERFFEQRVLSMASFQQCLCTLLSSKLCCDELRPEAIREAFGEALAGHRSILEAACRDLQVVMQRDPACRSLLQALLFSRGFQALQAHRFSHALWKLSKTQFALLLQHRIAERFTVDIHPAAVIGKGVFIDHGHGVVIGETAVVDDDVSIFHEVTLGGTGKERGDRHPKIRAGVLLAAGAKVLGRVVVGEGAKVAACSVVLSDVPPFSTVAGIPAKLVQPAGAAKQLVESTPDAAPGSKPAATAKKARPAKPAAAIAS